MIIMDPSCSPLGRVRCERAAHPFARSRVRQVWPAGYFSTGTVAADADFVDETAAFEAEEALAAATGGGGEVITIRRGKSGFGMSAPAKPRAPPTACTSDADEAHLHPVCNHYEAREA